MLHTISLILVILGGINWFLVSLFGWEIGQMFGGQGAMTSRIVYFLVGLAAIHQLLILLL